MVRLYCFLRLNLKTSTFLPRSLPVIVPVILCSAVSGPASTSPASLKTASTFENSISAPISPASLGTRITSPGATRNCFPPVSIMACIGEASIGKPEHRSAAGLNGVNLDSITSGGHLPNPGTGLTQGVLGSSGRIVHNDKDAPPSAAYSCHDNRRVRGTRNPARAERNQCRDGGEPGAGFRRIGSNLRGGNRDSSGDQLRRHHPTGAADRARRALRRFRGGRYRARG